ncbi:glutamate receptor 2 [Hyalella azteca]|uniref:Glutamate receptor 2 n=1 Tax=Hyalella azteca TaxID=294128 RepID=A0A979FLB5_HYAAZ|nr:glutamate receptor 2 [Hyalella azteca]
MGILRKLVTTIVTSQDSLHAYKDRDWTGLRLVVCRRADLAGVIDVLPWPLNNRALILVPEDIEFSAWEAYRASAAVPAVYQYLTAVSVPPLQEQLDVLRREPWSRRTNLTGLVMRCLSGDYPPFSLTSPMPDGTITVSGFAGDVWASLEKHLSFRSECRAPDDGLWGNYDAATGRWDGALGQLQRGDRDVVVSPFLVNLIRRKFFEFSSPLYSSRMAVIVQKPESFSSSSNYTREFTETSWLVVAGLFLLSVMTMKIFSNFMQSSRTWSDCFIENVQIFCNMGYRGSAPDRWSYRIWLLTALFAVVLLNVGYTSFLTAMLLSHTSELPIKTLQDIYDKKDDFSLGLVKDSSTVILFKFAEDNDVLLRGLWREMISKDPRNLASEKANVERSLHDRKHISIMDYDYYMNNLADCHLAVLPEMVIMSSTSFPLRRQHPANQIINYVLLKMSESGVLRKLFKKWQKAAESCESEQLFALGLAETYTAFVLLAVGIVIAFVVLVVEKFLGRAK